MKFYWKYSINNIEDKPSIVGKGGNCAFDKSLKTGGFWCPNCRKNNFYSWIDNEPKCPECKMPFKN